MGATHYHQSNHDGSAEYEAGRRDQKKVDEAFFWDLRQEEAQIVDD
jgi:hypothetical protein